METEVASEKSLNEVSKNKTVSVNYHCVLFSLLDFLTPDDVTDRVSCNVSNELPLSAT